MYVFLLKEAGLCWVTAALLSIAQSALVGTQQTLHSQFHFCIPSLLHMESADKLWKKLYYTSDISSCDRHVHIRQYRVMLLVLYSLHNVNM